MDGDVRLDNYSVNPRSMKVRKLIAFVAQDDSLQMTATPREAIAFSARLRLPRSTSDRDIKKLTDRMLTELGKTDATRRIFFSWSDVPHVYETFMLLGLDACADTMIGGPLKKGLSGGERKRTSVGVELCCKPDLLFLDEPTSGLVRTLNRFCEILFCFSFN